MAKTREEKEKQIKLIEEKIDQAKSVVFVDYKGLSVGETEELRSRLHQNDGDFSVVKNSLLKIAFERKKIEIDSSILNKPLALAVSYLDEMASARETKQYSKEHQNLEIMGGIMEGNYIDPERVSTLASIPTQKELYAKLVGAVSAPMSGFVNVLSGNMRGLLSVLRQYSQIKE